LRLLLDEHYSPRIAGELRSRGHDAVSVQERDDLRGIGDRELFERAAAERRAFVTENVADFAPLVREAAAGGVRHFGLVYTSPRSMPRGAGTIGLYVERLDELLRAHVPEDALADRFHWLAADTSLADITSPQ
jgi:Domain of unknown function (DUF5615)